MTLEHLNPIGQEIVDERIGPSTDAAPGGGDLQEVRLTQSELLAARQRGIRIVRDPNVDSERPNVFREGYDDQYLAHEYLAEYLAKRPEYYAEIPLILNQLLAPVFTREYLERAVLTGSIAKCMAAGISEFFWDYPEFFQNELGKFRVWYGAELAEGRVDDDLARDAQFVTQTLEYLSTGPADVDFKILPQQKYKGRFGDALVESLGDGVKYAGGEVVAQDVAGNDVYRHFYTGDIGSFSIEINYGPIPTNPDREGIEILLRDPTTGKIAFKSHIGYMPEEARDAWLDRRMGETSDWQDLVNADIYSDGEWMRYSMSRETAAVMSRTNMIPEPERDRPIGAYAENGIRVLRDISLYLDEEAVDFNSFFPYLDRASVFAIRRNAHRCRDTRERIPPNGLPIVFREFLLIATIDPYLLAHFLEHSHYDLIIPGLVEKSDKFWRQVLMSDALGFALDRRTRRPYSRRDESYIARQREAYKERKREGDFSGAELLLDAIKEIEDREGQLQIFSTEENEWPTWIRLYRLFKEKEEQKNRGVTFFSPGEQLDDSVQVAYYPLGEGVKVVWSLSGENVPVEPRLQRQLIAETQVALGKDGFEQREHAVEEWESWLERMRSQKHILINGEYEEFKSVFKEEIAREMFFTMHGLGKGLTAREIRDLVKNKSVSDEEFRLQLLVAKLAGWLTRDIASSKDREGRPVNVDLYNIRHSRELTDISQLTDTTEYRRIYEALTGFGPSQSAAKFNNAFKRGGIHVPLEVMGTLTAEDFNLMARKGHIKNIGDARNCARHARRLYEAFVRYREFER